MFDGIDGMLNLLHKVLIQRFIKCGELLIAVFHVISLSNVFRLAIRPALQ